MKKRIGYIDIAKCIAIIFIVIGHTGLVFNAGKTPGGMPQELVAFAFSFHLPVFFVASGYFFSLDKKLDWAFVKKDARSLLLPYVVTAAIIVVVTTANGLFSETMHASQEFQRWFTAALWGAGDRSPVALWPWPVERIGGIWFLLAMFWARMLIAATHKLPDVARLGIMVAALAAGVVSAHYVWPPFSIQSGIGCALYIFIGQLIRKHNLFEPGAIRPLVWVALAAVWAAALVGRGAPAIAMCNYPNGALDVAGGIAASFCVIGASRAIENHAARISAFMQLVGRNTLSIFALHIVEDNVVPWAMIGANLSASLGGSSLTWVIVLAMRFALDALIVLAAYLIPGIRMVYFPQLRKAKLAKRAEQETKAQSQG